MEKDLISSASGRVEGVTLRILAEPGKRHDETAGGGGDGGEKKSGQGTPVRERKRATRVGFEGRKVRTQMAVASEAQEPAMMWARPTCISRVLRWLVLARVNAPWCGASTTPGACSRHRRLALLPRAEGVSTRSGLQASLCEAWHHAVT